MVTGEDWKFSRFYSRRPYLNFKEELFYFIGVSFGGGNFVSTTAGFNRLTHLLLKFLIALQLLM